MKSCDRYIKFALLTGVTKFSKVSVFSDLNNLMDISMSNRFANLCGITEEELYSNFKEDIIELGRQNKLNEEETKAALKEMYDGYHFTEESKDIYNPFSLLNTFAEMRFGSYWFETGTPTFLVELLKQSRYDLHRLTEEMASADSLGGIDTMNTNPVPILYQSGYLTIKGYDREFQVYYLGFPNKEVEEGFTKFLLPRYAHLETGNPSFEIMSFVCRQPLRTGTRPGTALPECAFHRLQAAGLLYASRVSYLPRTHRHGGEDRQVHLCHGVQVGWHCRRSATTD